MNDNNTNKSETIWADGTWVRSKTFDSGDEILRLSILVDKFAPFVKKYKNANGYINLIISKKRQPDEKSTHCVKLDTFVPNSPKPVATPIVKKVSVPLPQKPVAIEDENMF